jgi:hypothetical protein
LGNRDAAVDRGRLGVGNLEIRIRIQTFLMTLTAYQCLSFHCEPHVWQKNASSSLFESQLQCLEPQSGQRGTLDMMARTVKLAAVKVRTSEAKMIKA